MLYCPNFFWNVLQVWMTGKDVYLQMTWSWPDKTWNILCSYCLQWNTSQSKFRNHYFLFLFAFSTLSQLFLIWGCRLKFKYHKQMAQGHDIRYLSQNVKPAERSYVHLLKNAFISFWNLDSQWTVIAWTNMKTHSSKNNIQFWNDIRVSK